ncbi:MAG: ribose-phosphate pyrophosphokinase [Myxococcota bacterium]|nr:ribose-phosphate pyrophosphokinase [Myxococcota bacterium]
MPTDHSIKLFAGNSNPSLARKISEVADLPLGAIRSTRFSDGEMFVEIGENVRGADVFIIQSTCPPANENLMEMLIMIDAFKRASAKSICAVIPYYGYARQDRKVSPRTPITSKLVADLLTSAGADRVLSVDLHAGQIQGFFDVPYDHLFAKPVMLEHMKRSGFTEDCVIVSPDAGGVERARSYAKSLGVNLAIIDKRRPQANVAKVMNIVGDVEGLNAVLLDDMIDTAGTLTEAANALVEKGAKSVTAYATHPVLSGPAIARISESAINKVVVSDTVPLSEEAIASGRFEVVSVAGLLAKAIRRIHYGESVSSLFV